MSNASPATGIGSVAGFAEGAQGVTAPADPAGTGGFLSDVIVDLGFVDREIVERAVEAARQPGRMVDRILLENGDLTEELLSRALAERHGLDHVDLDRFQVDMSAASLISGTTALRYRAIPIAFATDGALIVAVADPVDALAISDLEVMTRTETRRVVASGATIDALAQRLPEVGTPQPSAPSSATEARGEPSTREESAPAATVKAEIDELEAATEQSTVVAGAGGEAPQPLEQASQPTPAADPEADRRQAESDDRIAALEAELAKADDLMREQAEESEAERNRSQDQAIEVAGERDRLREELGQVTRERDDLSAEAQRRADELTSLQERATRAESAAEEASARIRELEDADRRAETASARIRELEDADRRAETARLALKELREESEREREQSSRLERKLGEDLAAAQERSAALERRLHGLTAAASEAQAMAEELLSVNRAIAGDDLPDSSDDPPASPAADPPTPAANNGSADDAHQLGATADPPPPAANNGSSDDADQLGATADPPPPSTSNGASDEPERLGPEVRKPTI